MDNDKPLIMKRIALIILALLSFEAANSQTLWGGFLFPAQSTNKDSLTTFSSGSLRTWFAANLKSFVATQDAIASVGSGSGTAAGNVATITGAAGGATSANSGTVTGGTGGKIIVTGGNGGAITGTPGTGFGGTGGEISLTAGDGGLGTTFGGSGGNANLQAGIGGNGTTPGSGGYASVKGGNGSASGNSSGGNVFIVGGSKSGSGQDGDIYLGVSPAFAARGRVKIGGTSTPTTVLALGEAGSRSGTLSMDGSTSGTVTIQPAAAAGTYTLTLPTTDGAASEFLQTDGNGVLSWAAASGSGITTLNALTAATQTFAVGTAGTDFAITSGTSTHTFDLPTASAANRGALSSADWTTFNGKQAAGNYITALTGDVTASGPGSAAATVTKINGTSLAGLGTGILKNTTGTGVPSIAIAGDFPTLNQNTTGSAATLTTPRAIYGNNFDGSAALNQVISSTYGGTGNGFTKFSGPTTSEKTFTLPNANATVLTDNTAVTVPQGGTGRNTSTTSYGLIAAGTTATGAHQTLAAGATTDILVGGGASALPSWVTATGSGAPVRATSPSLTTPSLGTPSSGNLVSCTNYQAASLSGQVPVANGGTGAATLTGILQGNGTSAITGITNSSTVGQILRVTGASTYAWGALDLADADAVTGVLPFANGGQSITTGRVTGQTAANSSIATLTVGGADASYIVSANVNVTTSSSENFNVNVAYTDEGNTARTVKMSFSAIDGTLTPQIRFTNGATPYGGVPMHIRCKASTTITITSTGTFTGATYNVEGKIMLK